MAGVGGVAILGASGSSDNSLVGVTSCRHFLSLRLTAAIGAGVGLDASFGAGRLSRYLAFVPAVTGSGDNLALGNQLAAVGAVGVASVAILGAGGILSASDFGVIVLVVDGQFLGAANGIVDLLVGDGDGSLAHSTRITGKGQGCHSLTGGDAFQFNICKDDSASGLVIDGGILRIDIGADQGQICSIIGNSHLAVVGHDIVTLSVLCSHGDSDGVLIIGNRVVRHGQQRCNSRVALKCNRCSHCIHSSSIGSLSSLGLQIIDLRSSIAVLVHHHTGIDLGCIGLNSGNGSSQFLSRNGNCVHLHRASGRSHSSSLGILIDGNRSNGRGPHSVTHVAKPISLIRLGRFIEGQTVEFIGIASVSRQVQIAVLANDHGTIHILASIIAREVHIQIGGNIVQPCAESAILGGINPEIPNITCVIQHQDKFSIHILTGLIVQERIVASRCDRHQVGSAGITQPAAQAKGRSIQSHRILCGQEVIVVDTIHLGGFRSGVNLTVLHIPQRDASVICANLLNGASSGIHQMHTPGIAVRIHDVELIVGGVLSSGGHAGIDGRAAGPSLIGLHIPLVEHGVTILILQGTCNGDVQRFHRDSAACADGGIQIRGRSNGSRAHIHTCDLALRIDSCNALISGRPSNSTVRGRPGLDSCTQGLGSTLEEGHGSIRQLNTADLISGICPITATASLHGNNQCSQFIPQIVVDSVLASCRVDLHIICATKRAKHEAVGIPTQHTSVGVDFHRLNICAGDFTILHFDGFNQLRRSRNRIQRKAIDIASAIAIDIEGAIGITCQGIGGNADLINRLDLSSQLVDGNQVTAGNAINVTIGLVIRHVSNSNAHAADQRHIRQIVLRHNVQITGICRCQNHVVYDGSREERQIAEGINFQALNAGIKDTASIILSILIKCGPVVFIQIECDHLRQRNFLADLHLDGISNGVHGIVSNLEQELLAVHAAQIQDILSSCIGCNVLLRTSIGIQLGTRSIVESDRRDILVIGCSDVHGVASQADGNILQHRRRVIDDHGHGEIRTVAQRIPRYIARGIHIVFRSQRQGQFKHIALSSIHRHELGLQTIASIPPSTTVHIVISRIDRTRISLYISLTSGLVYSSESGSSRISNGYKLHHADHIAIFRVDGVTLRHIGVIGNHGVAAEVIIRIGVIRISNRIRVSGHIAQIRDLNLITSGVLRIGTNVVHGGIRPVAIEAQHGDGVGSALLAFLSGQAFCKDIALNVSAIGIVIVNGVLPILRNGHIHSDFHRTRSGNHNGILHIGEEQISIVGIDVAISIQVSQSLIGQFTAQASGVVQQGNAVIGVDKTITVEVHFGQIQVALDGLTIHIKADIRTDQGGRGIHEDTRVRVVVHITHGRRLNKEIAAKGIDLLFISQVVDGESEAIFAGLIGIVAQLGLDLAISVRIRGILAHQNVSIRRGSCSHICQASALLEHRIVAAAAIGHGLSSGHQQAVDQRTVAQASLSFQTLFTDVLGHDSSHTCHLGRCHRGTGHDLILVRSAAFRRTAIDGVDTAARGSDLRLQFQAAGNTPAGERTHRVVIAVELGSSRAAANGHLSSVVQHVASIVSHSSGCSLDGSTLSLGDGNDRLCVRVIRQVHVDDAGSIVVNNGCNGTCFNRCNSLLKEGSRTTGTQGNLTRQSLTNSGPLLGRTKTVDQDKVMLTSEGCQRLIAVNSFVVNHHHIAYLEVQAGGTVVIHRSNRQGVGEGSRRAIGLHADIISVQIAHVVCILHPGTGVTSGHAHDGICLS